MHKSTMELQEKELLEVVSQIPLVTLIQGNPDVLPEVLGMRFLHYFVYFEFLTWKERR